DQVPRLDATGAPPRPARKFVAADDELIAAVDVPGESEEPEERDERRPIGLPNWEKMLVDAAVVGGYHRWQRRLRGLENEFRKKLTEVHREDDPSRTRIERQIEQLDSLERFALPLIEYLETFGEPATWGLWIERLSELAGMSLRRPESVLSVLAELQPMSEI